MKVRLIALAALATMGSAHALTPAQIDAARGAGTLKEVYVAGASAQRLFLGAWFQEQCTPGTFDVFFDGTAPSPTGKSYRAYSCNLATTVGAWTAGTPVLLVKRDAGGSIQGVNPIAQDLAQDFMNVDSSNCVATGKPSPAADILNPGFACATTGVTARKADAGVSDVEPALFQQPVNLPSPSLPLTATQLNGLNSAPINQTIFGVIVNKALYYKLQEAQGKSVGSEAEADMPSLRAEFVAAALEGKLSGSTATRTGWNIEVPNSVDSQSHLKQVNICRRVVGSGTQASFNAFFNNAGCDLAKGGKDRSPTIFGQTIGAKNSTSASVGAVAALGTKSVSLGSGSGDVEICVGTTAENIPGAYALGLLSRENTPTPTGAIPPVDKGYRFVKLDGMTPSRDAAKVGNYPLVYSATMQWNKVAVPATGEMSKFLTVMRANAGKATSLNIADVDTQQGVLAMPSTWTGAYDSLPVGSVTEKFASRVDRNPAQSCSPLRIVK